MKLYTLLLVLLASCGPAPTIEAPPVLIEPSLDFLDSIMAAPDRSDTDALESMLRHLLSVETERKWELESGNLTLRRGDGYLTVVWQRNTPFGSKSFEAWKDKDPIVWGASVRFRDEGARWRPLLVNAYEKDGEPAWHHTFGDSVAL